MKRNILLACTIATALVVALPANAKDKKKNKKQQAEAFVLQKPVLENAGDSTAYIFGISQSNGLKAYMQQQLKVDTTYINLFAKGIMDRASIDQQNQEQHAYYAGQQIGGQIEQMTQQFSRDYYAAEPDKKVDPRIVAAAIVEGLLEQNTISADSAMTQFRAIMNERQKANDEALKAQTEKLYGSNKAEGERFLKENKTKEGVIVLPSGLQYKVLTEGTGAIPTAKQTVKVNYEGHLVDGTEFDSSYKRGKPASFRCDQVIKGWTEALCKMPVGSKWELYIPQELAYGERESGTIKPFSALIFTVELLEIEDKK